MKPISKTQTGVGNSTPLPLNTNISPMNTGFVAQVNGSCTYGIFYTLDDLSLGAPTNWFPTSIAAGAVATAAGSLLTPATALQIQQTAGSGTVTLVATQAGIQ